MSNDDVLDVSAEWLAQGHKVALGTVVKTWGSAPRPAGSQIAVRDDGAFVGSVSGGCVEGAVIESGQDAIRTGSFRRLEFGVSDADAWAVGLACGGHIEILVEPFDSARKRSTLDALNRGRTDGIAIVRAVDLQSGEERLIDPASDNTTLGVAAGSAARADRSAPVEIDGRVWFLSVHNPPLDMVIIGAVHIAQILAPMAVLAEYRVRIIDPRTAFATSARFPGVTLTHDWPDEALVKVPLGPRSALIALTHDPKLDDPALTAALRSDCFYIGALGSKKTHAGRLARLKAHGFSDDDLTRIHGPIGLAIGARSPAEIAISILAEVTLRLRADGDWERSATRATA
ncbi:MAG: XdhC family protein [Rhizomicrobium sp.]